MNQRDANNDKSLDMVDSPENLRYKLEPRVGDLMIFEDVKLRFELVVVDANSSSNLIMSCLFLFPQNQNKEAPQD